MYDKKLIVYFSDSGNTKKLAEMIQAAVGGDIMDIKAPKPDFGAYDLIFLGTPNYSATVAGPMADYIKGIDLKGKTVAPFCTHGMGGLQNVGDDMTKLCTAAGAGKVFPTIPVKGVDVAQAGEKLAAWLKECGIC
jgi:flavodoxin